MSSRKDEKAQRRAEREAAEAAARRAQVRHDRLRIAGGGLLAVVVIVGVVLALASRSGETTGDARQAAADVPIPEQKITDLADAAEAAGCKVTSPPVQGQTHVSEPVEYEQNPPSSGDHSPEPALDGIYDPGTSPEPENWVHSLEHGRVVVQYKPGTPQRQIGQLETVVSEELKFGRPAYLTTLLENTTEMKPGVVAAAWGQVLSCATVKPELFDAIRAFRTEFTDRGPEVGIPPTN